MKLLVTGAGGQLGKEWVAFLKDNKITFTAYDYDDLDITNTGQVQKKLKEKEPDIVINCAAYTNVDAAEDNPELAFKVNALGPEILAKECRKYRAKLVHYSTDYIFPGREEDADRFPDGYTEDAPPAPLNIYGSSKKEGEDAIVKTGGDWLLIRVAWLCGQFGNNFLKTMLRLGKEKKEVNVVNDQIGSPTFCHDVVDKTFQLINKEEKGAFHVSSKGKISWYDFAKKIFELEKMEVTCNPVSTESFPLKAARPKFSLLNTAKIKDIGLEPMHWETGTAELLHQLKKHS